jgi:anion-transporting  ArsA/GET3 family ATPase
VEVLIAAVVGVCGTLCATWLTQRSAARSIEGERQNAERLRRLEEKTRGEERVQERRLTNYVTLNQRARQYFGALNNSLHGLPESAEQLDELHETRSEYRACYAEAQMVVPDQVLTVASAVNRELNQAYGILRRLHGRNPREPDSPELARAHLDTARDLLHDLRREMRLDLGVTLVNDGSTE